MKQLIMLFTGLLLFSCSPSKNLEMNSFKQNRCHSEETLRNAEDFTAETAENLLVFREGGYLNISFDVRGRCESEYALDIERQGDRIKLRLLNESDGQSSCVCTSNLTATFEEGESGDLTVMVTNEDGTQLLAQKRIIVTK